MTSISRLLHRPHDSRTRIILTAGDDPAVIEAAYRAATLELLTPMLIGSEEKAHEIAASIPTDDLIFLDFIDLVTEATPPVELASLLVREGVAHGALFGADIDVMEGAEGLEDGEPLSASVFLELPTGQIIVLTAGLDEASTKRARLGVEELVGSDVRIGRLAPEDIGDVEAGGDTNDLVFGDAAEFDVQNGDLLRTFGAANMYGPLFFGSSIPAAFLRPGASVDDVLGSLALLTALIGPQSEAIDVSPSDHDEVTDDGDRDDEPRSLFLPPERDELYD